MATTSGDALPPYPTEAEFGDNFGGLSEGEVRLGSLLGAELDERHVNLAALSVIHLRQQAFESRDLPGSYASAVLLHLPPQLAQLLEHRDQILLRCRTLGVVDSGGGLVGHAKDCTGRPHLTSRVVPRTVP
jgi:hypothetical protein